ncbi:hypothetical protein Tco_0754657 [Tanacetum coccineum]
MGTMAEYQTLQIELLRARPITLGEPFSLASIIEARLEAIAEKEKERIFKKKANTILSLRSELNSPEIKGSLGAEEDIYVDEVSSAIDGVFDIGESLVVFLKWVQISISRPLLLMVRFENTDVAMGKEVKDQRRIWDPVIKIGQGDFEGVGSDTPVVVDEGRLPMLDNYRSLFIMFY